MQGVSNFSVTVLLSVPTEDILSDSDVHLDVFLIVLYNSRAL